MKLDLDEMEASLGFMADWKLLIEEVRHLREVAEAAREKLKIIYGPKLEAEQPCELLQALKKLDEARRK